MWVLLRLPRFGGASYAKAVFEGHGIDVTGKVVSPQAVIACASGFLSCTAVQRHVLVCKSRPSKKIFEGVSERH
jgi:hypothetical protein